MKRSIIFGASKLGELVFEEIKNSVNIIRFLDNDRKKWGKTVKGIPVNGMESIIKKIDEYDIIIASQYDLEIASQLYNLKIKRFKVAVFKNQKIEIIDVDLTVNQNKVDIVLIINSRTGSNTYALGKYLIENNISNIKMLKSDNKNTEYYKTILQSKMVIHTHERAYIKDKINIQLWHGFPLKGLNYMSKQLLEEKCELNHQEWLKLDCICSYSKMYNNLIGACYGIKNNQFKLTGMPRNDLLLKSKGKEKLEKILNRKIDEKVILYMPTFRESLYEENNGGVNPYIFNEIGFEEDFDEYLRKNKFLFIYNIHPNEKKHFTYKSDRIINLMDILNEYDSYEIIGESDILITDYSSIYFDYLLLNKPICFYIKDKEEYKANRGIMLEPFDFWLVGDKCYGYEELKNSILKNLSGDCFVEERKCIKNLVHHFVDANSSERIWKLIKNKYL